MLTRVKAFIKKETVLCIAALCAVATMFIIPPSGEYLHYIDFRVLCLLLCLLTVFRVIPYPVTTAIVVVMLALVDRKLLKEIDYMLLVTFVCFFVVSENLGRMDSVRELMQSLLGSSTLFTSVGASQIISNVPAAVLLSGFADQWKPLLAGVNIGGLGTPIASLASLITLKLYMSHPDAKVMKFLGVFMAANLIGLAILLPVSTLF